MNVLVLELLLLQQQLVETRIADGVHPDLALGVRFGLELVLTGVLFAERYSERMLERKQK